MSKGQKNKYLFQYCQKIVVFSKDNSQVLLAQRKGEADYDGVYSFIGGKMETTDKSLIEGMKREKNEEVGEKFIIRLNPVFNTSNYFIKKDGNSMILSHYYSQYVRGGIELNDEYSNYKWVAVNDLDHFQPLVETIPEMTKRLLRLFPFMNDKDFIEI